MRRILFLAVLLFALPAGAVNDWGYTGCESGNKIGSSGKHCFDVDSTGPTDSFTTFSVSGNAALACLKTDVDQEGVSATGASPITAVVRYCPWGNSTDLDSTDGDSNCGIQVCAQAGCTLTGLQGDPNTQLSCVVVGPGVYRVDFPTLPDGADIGLFTVQGGD